jgi:hypothetical protein
MLDKQDYTRARMHMPTHASTHARAHTHKQICDTYCFPTATMIHEPASVLRYTYIICFVHIVVLRMHKVFVRNSNCLIV